MPTYCYRCKHCGHRQEQILSMHDIECVEIICEKCEQKPMNRDYGSESKGVIGTEQGDTFWSQSLAISPSQAIEHKRMFPNVRVRSDGCLGFDSVKERESYIDRTGFYKVPGKTRRQTKPVKKKSPSTPAV